MAGLVAPAIFFSAAAPAQLKKAAPAKKPEPRLPLGLVPVIWPADNPYSPEKAELGRLLYFDKRLSADGTVSCATCHSPQFAFTDGAAVSTGIRGQKGGRSAPTVINRAYSLAQFWDGRAATLEAQAIGPMANSIEMGNTHDAVVSTLRGVAGYRELFKKAFGSEEFTIDHVARAITTFERTVLSGNAPYDR
ncbi:MAG: cytochrome-c peroxidase, partial [Bryobacteraceae bacterium]